MVSVREGGANFKRILESEYIEESSGPQGGLAKTMTLCGELNDSLTKKFDAFFTPNEVDSFDASCNTCRHFQRRPMTAEEKAERNIFGMPGHCVKKNASVRGWKRGQYCGFENANCYENRRTGMRPGDTCKIARN